LKITGNGVKICTKIAHPVVEQLRKEDREATEAATNSAPKNQLIKLPPYENSSLPPSSNHQRKEREIRATLLIVLLLKRGTLLIVILQECSIQEVCILTL